jgi:signal peptidase
VKQAAALPAPHIRPHPHRERGLTVAALGELGALVDPLRPLVAPVLERRRAHRAPGPVEEAAGGKARPSAPHPHAVEPAVPAAEPRAEKTAQPLGRSFLQSLRRPVNIAFLIVLTVLLTAWWVELRPAAILGGPATFITVKGVSMLPTLKTGDFVLAEAQPSYHVGDLVVYRVPKGQIGAGDDLIHRIVAGNATTGFTLKGDNNPAPDPWTVPRNDVLGKDALVIPGFGSTLLVLRSPLFAGLAAALIAMWVVLSPPEWLRPRKPAAAAAEATPSAGAAGTGHSAAELAPVEEPVPAAAAPEPAAPVAATSPARRRSRPPAKPAVPTARPTTRARPAGRTRAPRQEP